MNCPDWRRLSSQQENDPEAWERGLEHFDACGECRDQALAVEPTLMFRQLPAPKFGKSDVEAMKQAVAVLRRSEERRSSPPIKTSRFGLSAIFDLPVLRRRPELLRAAALVSLMVGAIALQGGRDGSPTISPAAESAESTVAEMESFGTELPSSSVTLASLDSASLNSASLSGAGASEILDPVFVDDLPLVEANDPTYGSVIQVVDDEISLLLLLPNDA